jgi:hypothetical protein
VPVRCTPHPITRAQQSVHGDLRCTQRRTGRNSAKNCRQAHACCPGYVAEPARFVLHPIPWRRKRAASTDPSALAWRRCRTITFGHRAVEPNSGVPRPLNWACVLRISQMPYGHRSRSAGPQCGSIGAGFESRYRATRSVGLDAWNGGKGERVAGRQADYSRQHSSLFGDQCNRIRPNEAPCCLPARERVVCTVLPQSRIAFQTDVRNNRTRLRSHISGIDFAGRYDGPVAPPACGEFENR